MEYNLLKIVFTLLSVMIVGMGILVNYVKKYIPVCIIQLFKYGKLAPKDIGTSRLKLISVPKRWFRHFYLFAAAFTAFAMVIATNIYFYEGTLRPWMVKALDYLASSHRVSSVSAVSAYLALSLITLQAWHRFYETWCISVFSETKIDISHYLIGYVHYFFSVTSIVAEAPGFFSNTGKEVLFSLHNLRLLDVIGAALFVAACFLQFQSALLLANLRKNSKGHVVTKKHVIPKGGLFEVVSSPHYLTEIVMYFALTLILWGSDTWPYIFLWVVCNQVETALLTHWWYHENFKQYPKTRKAIFPYIL